MPLTRPLFCLAVAPGRTSRTCPHRAALDRTRPHLTAPSPGRTRYNLTMSFCEHCEGQRFDRARVLRALRQVRKDLRTARQGAKCDAAIVAAMNAIRDLDIPHLEWDSDEDAVVH